MTLTSSGADLLPAVVGENFCVPPRPERALEAGVPASWEFGFVTVWVLAPYADDIAKKSNALPLIVVFARKARRPDFFLMVAL